METIKIEMTRLRGYHDKIYAPSRKQVDFIHSLMARRGMADEFQKYFMIGNKVICNHITKKSASKLIDALKTGKDIVFMGYVTTPTNLPEPKIKTLYKPIVPVPDVKRITVGEQKALEQKYIDEL
jgi:hypothetical protein